MSKKYLILILIVFSINILPYCIKVNADEKDGIWNTGKDDISHMKAKNSDYKRGRDALKQAIRYDKKGRYDPNLLTKIPFRGTKYLVDIKNKDSACSISNIYNFTKVRCDIFIDKVWKYNDKYVCKWKVGKILIH